jgi:hypothetical protein
MLDHTLYQMKSLLPGVFLVQMSDRHHLAYTFLRAQEFYESANPSFQGQAFSMEECKTWYASQSKTGDFSYSLDWRGFNVPSHSIRACYLLNAERTPYDELFLSIVSQAETMAKQNGLDDFYLIGAREVDADVLRHEIAHGLFTTQFMYKQHMLELVNELPEKVFSYLSAYLQNMGYASSVIADEIQAYLATGLRPTMDAALLTPHQEAFETYFLKTTQSFSQELASITTKNT